MNTPLQSYQSLSKLSKSAQKPPAPRTSPTASRNKHTVKLNTTSYWKNKAHTPIYVLWKTGKKTTTTPEDFHASSHHFSSFLYVYR